MTQEEYKDEVRRIRPKLLSVARRFLSDDEAEDTVQDVLLRLWQMLDELRLPIDALATVLVRNQCVSLLRKQRRIVALSAAVPDGFSSATIPDGFSSADVPDGFSSAAVPDGFSSAAVPDGFSVGTTNENLDRLMAIVERLPSLQQTILRLRHMEGMEMSDIANLIGSNEVALRKALSRARQAVRLQFLKQNNPE
jgi:RNA polymerase sigma-70 factor (ECF subfamily)